MKSQEFLKLNKNPEASFWNIPGCIICGSWRICKLVLQENFSKVSFKVCLRKKKKKVFLWFSNFLKLH